MDLGGLDLNLLVALDALLSERSVTRAAQRVGLSQPGMSNALARLRAAVRRPAARPPRRGARARRARAEALAGPVREALDLIRGAIEDQPRFDPARDRRSFRVSCSDYSVLMLIGPLVRAPGGRGAGRRRGGPPAPGRRRPRAARRRRRPRHRADRRSWARPICPARGSGRTAGCAASGRATPASASGMTLERLHRARAHHLLDGRRRAAGRAARPRSSTASACRGASR